ncbi:MAG: ribosomal protein S5-alanine N-acetyltransferase [Polyangiaceae bacterium]|nr:ribosomal protein S5-alanine N-acetyltransferase [Polyangiaceae bacterium]
MKNRPILETDRLRIRLPVPEDVPAILQFFTENRAFFKPTDPPRPEAFYTTGYWMKRVRSIATDYVQDKGCNFFLFEKAGNTEVVGYINLSNFVRGAFQACYLGYGLAEKHQGKGLMSEGLRAAIEHAWKTLRLHRIMANYLPHNERSAGVLKGLGFVVEGYAKDYLYINGRWQDHVLTALTNDRWEPPR